MRRARCLAALVLGGAAVLSSHAASAREPDTVLPGGPAYRYVTPAERQYVRAVIEEIAILTIGELEYQVDQSSNTVDWDLAYDWPSFRTKLTFQSVAFDTNRFTTNWMTHPAAGYLYYSAARSNRLSITESFLFGVGASTLWEYLGEFREQVSINDEIVTPMTGAVWGESTMQLGALFARSRRTPLTTVLAWLFAAPKSAHDAIDGAVVEPASELDPLGLPADEWHRFTFTGAGAVTKQDRGPTQGDARFSVSSRIVALEDYERRPGSEVHVFDSGEVSTLGFDVATSGGALVDMRIATSMMPAGFYERDMTIDSSGRLQGHGLLGGMVAGFEYGVHQYDRDGRRPIDEIAMVNLGATVEHALHVGPVVLRSGLDTLVDFAGVKAYALTRYLQLGHPTSGLPIVLAEQSYYHALGATLHPSLTVEAGPFDVSADARFDFFGAITALDRDRPADIPTPDTRDRRAWLRGAVGASPSSWLHLSVAAERRGRYGRIDGVTDSRGETSLVGNVDVRF